MTQQIFENQEATIPTDKLPQPEPTKTTQIDYTNLESLLKVRNFKQADEETYKLMLAVANRESEGYLITYQDAEKFPCKELRTIDQLWLKYSQGKFGISVQQQIYQSLGGTKESRLDVYDALGDRLGWRRKGQWLDYNNLNFSQTAPSGHLPAAAWDTGNFDGGLNFIAGGSDYNCF
ncbi:hypothetical protein B7O87_07025 [Cylindrospermopsis raciborskii CENA303]|uniref:GUN4-like domain-containing protein n=2 Tax=Cylindrospermopsis raciborskii TaxID=77022 RepID=A0A1X4G7S7_9CYAN|nr:hypothetical protein B7O87_07025 [Cylindrospermopsis raciborskii CENA303]